MYGWGCPESHGGVEIVNPESGGTAVRIRNARLHADAISRSEVGYLRAHLDNSARRLMAENHRLANNVWSDTSVLIVMQITPAYADSVKGDPHIQR